MIRTVLLVGMLSLFSWSPASALSEIDGLVRYDCESPNCTAQCTGPSTTLSIPYRQLLVFQWKEHVRRLWIAVGDKHYVLGDDTTCMFEGKASFQTSSSSLGPPPQHNHPCFIFPDGQTSPPGCRQ